MAMAVGGVMSLLAKYSWGRSLLLRYPAFFSYGLVSHEGPTQEQVMTCQSILQAVLLGGASNWERWSFIFDTHVMKPLLMIFCVGL